MTSTTNSTPRSFNDRLLNAAKQYKNIWYLSKQHQEDKEFVKNAISAGHVDAYLTASEAVRADPEVALAAIAKGANYNIPDKLFDSEHGEAIIKGLLASNSFIEEKYTAKYRDNKEKMKKFLQVNGSAYEWLSPELQEDQELITLALTTTPSVIRNIPPALVTKEHALLALSKDRDCIYRIPSELKEDPEILIYTIAESPYKLEYDYDSLADDRDFALKVVKLNGSTLENLSSRLREDKEIVLEAIRNKPSALRYADASLRADKDVVMEAVSREPSTLDNASETLRADTEIVKAAIAKDPTAIRYASDEIMLQHREMVMKAVEYDGYLYSNLPEALRRDKELAMAAIRAYQANADCLPEELKEDKQFMTEVIALNPNAFVHARGDLLADKGLALKCLAKNPDAIQVLAKTPLGSDLDVVKTAVQHGCRITHVLPAMQMNPEIIAAALKANSGSRSYIPEEASKNKEIVLKVLDIYPGALFWVHYELYDDWDVIFKAAKESLPRKLPSYDREIIRKLIEADTKDILGHLYNVEKYSSAYYEAQELFDNKELMKLAAEKGEEVIYYSQTLRADREIVLLCAKHHGRSALEYCPLFKDDEEVVMTAIANNRKAFRFASERLKSDKKFILAAVEKVPTLYSEITTELQRDLDIATAAISKDPVVITWAPTEIKNNKTLVLMALKKGNQIYFDLSSELKADVEVTLAAIEVGSSEDFDIINHCPVVSDHPEILTAFFDKKGF